MGTEGHVQLVRDSKPFCRWQTRQLRGARASPGCRDRPQALRAQSPVTTPPGPPMAHRPTNPPRHAPAWLPPTSAPPKQPARPSPGLQGPETQLGTGSQSTRKAAKKHDQLPQRRQWGPRTPRAVSSSGPRPARPCQAPTPTQLPRA